MVNRKRVQDLVTINDALKAYHAKNGAYPEGGGLAGANERGADWIPGLAPDFVKELPRDPMHGARDAVCLCVGRRELQAAGAGRVAGRQRQCGSAGHQDRSDAQSDAAERGVRLLDAGLSPAPEAVSFPV